MDNTPVKLKLATAADAIAEMADVFAARADEFFSGWHRQRVAHEGPILDDDLFAEFVRQSFHLDLDELVGVPELYVRSASEKSNEDADSVVEEVSKEQALLLAGAEAEEEPLPVAVLEHDEDAGAWAAVLREWMRERGMDEVSFLELMSGVGLSVVKVWLALLLGEFEIQQEGEFYERKGIMVSFR
jgi:hypothetical protein